MLLTILFNLILELLFEAVDIACNVSQLDIQPSTNNSHLKLSS
jgi:hypothetical protein